MIEKLQNILPLDVYAELLSITDKFSINTELRLSHFISQCDHESGGFKHTVENLNYSEDGLNKIFPKYFPNGLAVNYARNPEKIANRIYADRMGNGDEASGDGWKYRGKGYIQLTGKNNNHNFSMAIGDENILTNPELISTKYPLTSAAWFWGVNHINPIADLGSTEEIIAKVTKVINGGVIGLSNRIELFNKYYTILKTQIT